MPVEFLTDEQAAKYGRFDGHPTPEQLAQYFLLTEADLHLIAQRRRKQNKLGVALQLCTLRFLGTVLTAPLDWPSLVVTHVAQQLQLSPEVLTHYGERDATRSKHRALVLAHLGYREFSEWQAVSD